MSRDSVEFAQCGPLDIRAPRSAPRRVRRTMRESFPRCRALRSPPFQASGSLRRFGPERSLQLESRARPRPRAAKRAACETSNRRAYGNANGKEGRYFLQLTGRQEAGKPKRVTKPAAPSSADKKSTAEKKRSAAGVDSTSAAAASTGTKPMAKKAGVKKKASAKKASVKKASAKKRARRRRARRRRVRRRRARRKGVRRKRARRRRARRSARPSRQERAARRRRTSPAGGRPTLPASNWSSSRARQGSDDQQVPRRRLRGAGVSRPRARPTDQVPQRRQAARARRRPRQSVRAHLRDSARQGKTVADLKKAAKTASEVWFATDLDREGRRSLGTCPSFGSRCGRGEAGGLQRHHERGNLESLLDSAGDRREQGQRATGKADSRSHRRLSSVAAVVEKGGARTVGWTRAICCRPPGRRT